MAESTHKEVPGGFDAETSGFELDYWENYGGVEAYDLHLQTYKRAFPVAQLDYSNHSILDIGSGAVSVFEGLAPESADITPYDLLAEDYNRIAPGKKFSITDQVDEHKKFSLITLFNMIDHVIHPEQVMQFAARHLQTDGKLWLAVHLYQPHGPVGHPQNYSVSSIIDFVSGHFHIARCSVLREAIPHPYVWYAELDSLQQSPGTVRLLWLKAKNLSKFYALQSIRVAVKLVKLIGGRKLLPKAWQF